MELYINGLRGPGEKQNHTTVEQKEEKEIGLRKNRKEKREGNRGGEKGKDK